jgi:hypothetical protein
VASTIISSSSLLPGMATPVNLHALLPVTPRLSIGVRVECGAESPIRR